MSNDLEAIAEAARDYLRARSVGSPWPRVAECRERLRVLLNEPPEPEPLVKPWERLPVSENV